MTKSNVSRAGEKFSFATMSVIRKIVIATIMAVIAAVAAVTLVGCVDVSNATGGRADEFLQSLDEDAPSVPLSRITVVYNQGATVVEPSTPLNNLKANLTVTAHYVNNTTRILPAAAYTLSGSLNVGTSTITVTYEDQTATFTVTVTLPDLPDAPLVSITAVYDSTEAFYLSMTLDDLKSRLIVTAEYGDGQTRQLSAGEYTLTGGEMNFLNPLERTVTVTHVDRNVTRMTTFTVTLSAREAVATLYTPTQFGGAVIDLSLVSGATILEKAFNYANANPDEYTLVLESDVEILAGTSYEISGLTQSGATLRIVGHDTERVIVSNAWLGMTINVGTSGASGATDVELIFGENVALINGLVSVNSGVFTMQDNSWIRRESIISSGGVRVGDRASFIMRDNALMYSGVDVNSGGSFVMEGHAAVEYASVSTGNSVAVNNATFIMQDDASVRNGGVSVNGGRSRFTMRGNASVYNGGGVSINGGGTLDVHNGLISVFTMQDYASVYNNDGVGVSVRNGVEVIMEGNSSVYGNSGSGLYIGQGGMTSSILNIGSWLVMRDDAAVYGNETTVSSRGGGVHLDQSEFIMSGNAVIHSNVTAGNGGGVHVDRSDFVMEGNASIYGNRAAGNTLSATSGSGGGVYMTSGFSASASGARFTMSGGTIHGLDAPFESQRNTAARSGAALFVHGGTAEYGDGAAITGIGSGVDLTVDGRR